MDEILKSSTTQGLGVILSIYFVYYITKVVTTRLDNIECNQRDIADAQKDIASALIKIVERQPK